MPTQSSARCLCTTFSHALSSCIFIFCVAFTYISIQVYIVKDGALRGVPDGDTFLSMGYSFEKIMVVGDKEVEALWVGDALPRKVG